MAVLDDNRHQKRLAHLRRTVQLINKTPEGNAALRSGAMTFCGPGLA